jgi:molybdate-binding protein
MIFEPRVICGQFVTLESSTDASFNGDYKITSVKHRGVISPVVSGDAITTLGLDNSAQALGLVAVEVA